MKIIGEQEEVGTLSNDKSSRLDSFSESQCS